jgi:hypothetical protein
MENLMERGKQFSYGQLGVGIFLLIAGIALLLDNFAILNGVSVWKLWPVILIAIGIGRLLDARSTGEYQKGFWLLFIGSWFLVSELHIFGLNYHNSWPILLIGVGIGMLWKSIYPSHNIIKDHSDGN